MQIGTQINETISPCVICGVQFRARRSDAKTCGGRCRSKLSRQKRSQGKPTGLAKKKANVIVRPCLECGQIMSINGTQQKRDTCSDKCRKRYNRKGNRHQNKEKR